MRRELRAMLALAWPVVLAEIGWILMGVVDTIFVGPLGPAAIGAVGIGSTIFFTTMVLGTGTLLALDTFVSQSYGARRLDECHRWMYAGLHLAAIMSIVLIAAGLLVVAWLPLTGIHPDVLVLLRPYLRTLYWSIPPLLLFTVLRRYLQAIGQVRAVMLAVVAANLVNAAANWMLIYGHLGLPALGTVGAAYATLASRICLLAVLWAVVFVRQREEPGDGSPRGARFVIEPARIWKLARLGLPAALQFMLEVGVFTAVAMLAGRISPSALAANQIVLSIASFFFMIPYGLASAAAVRVGQAVGRRDRVGVRGAGRAALALALTAAAAIIALFVGLPHLLLRIFTADPGVLALGATLLLLCALFQPFDGFQVVATGALRGIGDTRTPMWCNLAGHWLIGLPFGYVLCFSRGWGVVGLWAGLTIGLMLIGATLVLVWEHRSRTAAV